MSNAIAMLRACGEGQRPKFDGPACEVCEIEPGTVPVGAALMCWQCAVNTQLRRLRGE